MKINFFYVVILIIINNIVKFFDVVFIDFSLFFFNKCRYSFVNLEISMYILII